MLWIFAAAFFCSSCVTAPFNPTPHTTCSAFSPFPFQPSKNCSKYIENTATRSKNTKLTPKCPAPYYMNSEKQLFHNIINWYMFPSCCLCPEVNRIMVNSSVDQWHTAMKALITIIFVLYFIPFLPSANSLPFISSQNSS